MPTHTQPVQLLGVGGGRLPAGAAEANARDTPTDRNRQQTFHQNPFAKPPTKGTPVARAIYAAPVGAAVALTATVAKTVLAIESPATFGIDLRTFTITLDGATSTAVPVFWELCTWSVATAGIKTDGTITQESGRAITAGFTSHYNYTTEPTALVAIEADYLPAFNGFLLRDYGFNEGPDNDVSKGFALRLTAPANVNARSMFRFGRC